VKRKTVGRKRPALGALRASHVPISCSSLGGLGIPFLWSGAAVENRELTGEVEFNDFFDLDFKHIFICSFLPFLLLDLEPQCFALENHWEVFSEPDSFFLGSNL
jgi:hypothetical protein